jgi:prepilin-type N-terminal cleavage/methylation domain-containing protein
MKKAFTLAEILITLGIIGIVAALTIPALINDANNLKFESAFKKAFSLLNETSILLKSDNSNSLVGVYNNSDYAIDAFCEKLKCINKCHMADDRTNCFRGSNWKMLDGRAGWTNYATEPGHVSATIADGMQLDMWWSPNCSMPNGLNNDICSEIVVDVNGGQAPNTAGRDMFYFYLSQTKVLPIGAMNAGYSYDLYPEYCNPKVSTAYYNGYACAGRIIQEGGMKY